MQNAVRVATQPIAEAGNRPTEVFSYNRARLDTWCERGIIALIGAILVYTPLATGAIRPQDFLVVQWLSVAVMVLWLARFWLNPEHRLLWPPVCWAVLAFMGYAVGRYFTADVEYTARQEVIKVLIYGFLFLAILHNLQRLDTFEILGLLLIALATGIALYGIIQFLRESDQVWHFVKPISYYKRGSGTFINPNHFAGYLEMLLPLAIAHTLTGRFSHLTKVFLGYACVVMFAGLLVSVSRGAWIASTGALLVLFFWLICLRDYRWKAVIVISVLAMIATLFVLKAELSSNRRENLARIISQDDLRFRIWRPALEIWRDHFWTGAGPGHFDFRFRQYRALGRYPDQMQVRPERVHNDYLNTLVDWGLIGALLVASAWALFSWDVFRGWKHVQRAQNDLTAKQNNKASFVMGGSLGLLAILLHSFTDYNMHMPANAILAVTIMALVAGHFRHTTERYWQTVHLPLRLLTSIVLVSAAAWVGVQSWKGSRERFYLNRAEAEPYYSNEQIAALEAAFAIDPQNFETAYLIGEGYRMQSWQGADNYRELAHTARGWLDRSIRLNPWYPYPLLRYGMCLDWTGKHEAAAPYFAKALALDPNGYYTQALVGWHYFQLEQWEQAKRYFERSLSLFWTDNPIARSYLELVNQKLSEKASGQAQMGLK
jgi:O-antigen ligase/cytochrome c-type biogenesis protein CcmH/NrfG